MNETNEIAEAKISWANTLLGKGFVMSEVIQLWYECLEFISIDKHIEDILSIMRI